MCYQKTKQFPLRFRLETPAWEWPDIIDVLSVDIELGIPVLWEGCNVVSAKICNI